MTAPKNQLIDVFLFDEAGYFSGVSVAMESPLEEGVFIYPPNSTTVEPELNPENFYRWDGEVWIAEPKPTKPEDFVGKWISHESQTVHDRELRTLIQKIITSDCKTHKIVRGDDLSWGAEPIPEKTEEEKLKEAEDQARAKRDYLISKTDYLLTADYPISAEDLEAVKAYRQALRDVPQQEGFPNDIEWPTMPEVEKIA